MHLFARGSEHVQLSDAKHFYMGREWLTRKTIALVPDDAFMHAIT